MKPVSQRELPPSVKPNLIGGHFRKFRTDPTGFLTQLTKLGDVSHFRMGSRPAFFLNHPDLIRDLFVVHAGKFIKGRALQRAKTLLGEGLLTSEGEVHLSQRRMMQPAFHRARIAEYAKSMVEYGDKMANTWTEGEVRFAKNPIGKVRWYWLIVFSLIGGIGFGIPFFYWLNKRKSLS